MTKAQKLVKMIKRYATSYYSGEAEVSDEYFDNLIDRLKEIDPNNEILQTPGWGYEPTRKDKHWWGLEIGSLPKIKEGEQIPSQYLKDTTRISAKLDGLSVVSYYIDGKRIQSLTRGNGIEGIDVTSKINIINPNSEYVRNPDGSLFTGAVRGEVVMPMSVWHQVYEPQKEINPSLNPRNIAAGLMNRKEDSNELKNLNYVVYKILHSEGYEYKDMISQLYFFNNENWTLVDMTSKAILAVDQFKELYEQFCERYPCDGLVLSNYDGSDWDEIAYKFQAESVEVTVKMVTWDASRTGKLNPLIWFEPVELSGAMVQKCTGYNAAFIRDNMIGAGAVIEVCRSNEVIPKCLNVLTPANKADLPTICPKCNNKVYWKGVDLVCDNENEAQLAYYFISTLIPLDGAGYSLYQSIIETFGLKTVDQLYHFLKSLKDDGGLDNALDYIDIKQTITGLVTTDKTRQILTELTLPVDPVAFLTACNIPKVSEATARSIMQEYPDFIKDCIRDELKPNNITNIKGIGEAVLNSILEFESRIVKLGSLFDFTDIAAKTTTMFKVAITGALSMKRADFDKELQAHGIEQSDNFKEIKYLITNNPRSGSSKMQNAKKYGIEVISEEEFKNKYFN